MELQNDKTHDSWVTPNSDVLYKKSVQWAEPEDTIQPTEAERKMLEGTITTQQLIDLERDNKHVTFSPDEIRKQRTKSFMNMFKVITLDEMGYKPNHNPRFFNEKLKQDYFRRMTQRVHEYYEGYEQDIIDRFNNICNEKLFYPGSDISIFSIGC